MGYYNYDRICSYNACFHMILTNRGYGKTYGAKKRALNNFVRRGEQFVYVRRYKSEFKKIWKFFDDIQTEFPNNKLEVRGTVFYCDNKICGYAIPLSTSMHEKSTPFPLVTSIIFDEFILDKGYTRYIDNEVEILFELISTIVRKRDNWRCFLLANNVSMVNPYFKYFDVKMKDNERFVLAQDGECIVERSTDDIFMEEMKNTKFGRLIKNTKYSDYAIENKSLRDNSVFVEKIPLKNCTPLYCLTYKNEYIQIWIHKFIDVIYCNSKYVEGTELISILADDHGENTLLKGKTIKLSYIDEMIKSFQVGRLRFENQDVKQNVYEIFKKLGVR